MFLFICINSFSQSDSSQIISKKKDSIVAEKDLKDLFSRKRNSAKNDSLIAKSKNQKYFLTVLPAAGYTLQTGFAGLISANIGYYTDKV